MRYVFMEAGNSNQNIYLQAESLGLKVAALWWVRFSRGRLQRLRNCRME